MFLRNSGDVVMTGNRIWRGIPLDAAAAKSGAILAIIDSRLLHDFKCQLRLLQHHYVLDSKILSYNFSGVDVKELQI